MMNLEYQGFRTAKGEGIERKKEKRRKKRERSLRGRKGGDNCMTTKRKRRRKKRTSKGNAHQGHCQEGRSNTKLYIWMIYEVLGLSI
jgi:hypothetical protein